MTIVSPEDDQKPAQQPTAAVRAPAQRPTEDTTAAHEPITRGQDQPTPQETAALPATAAAPTTPPKLKTTTTATTTTSATTTPPPQPQSQLSRKERKREAARLNAMAKQDEADGIIMPDEESFPLGLPLDVVEFVLLPFCDYHSLIGLTGVSKAVTKLLYASDDTWQRLWRCMDMQRHHRWRMAKKNSRAIYKAGDTISFRKRCQYVMADPHALHNQQPLRPQKAKTPPPMPNPKKHVERNEFREQHGGDCGRKSGKRVHTQEERDEQMLYGHWCSWLKKKGNLESLTSNQRHCYHGAAPKSSRESWKATGQLRWICWGCCLTIEL